MKILVIDDCPTYLKGIAWLLKNSNINSEVVCFIDAFEALKYIDDHQKEIRVVFTDYNMKSME